MNNCPLYDKIRDIGLDDEQIVQHLAAFVHDTAERLAARVCIEGVESQIDFLLLNDGPDNVRDMIDNIESSL